MQLLIVWTRNQKKDSKSNKSQSDIVMINENKIGIFDTAIQAPSIEPEVKETVNVHKRIIIVNGKPQIDMSSLIVEQSQIRKEEDDPKYFKIINENSDSLRHSAIYKKRSHTKKWSQDETEFFYKCLTECGTDFSMIESKFKGDRNRTQIKNKYRKEENENPKRIEAAVYNRKVIPINKRDSKQKSKESSDFDAEFEEGRSQ